MSRDDGTVCRGCGDLKPFCTCANQTNSEEYMFGLNKKKQGWSDPAGLDIKTREELPPPISLEEFAKKYDVGFVTIPNPFHIPILKFKLGAGATLPTKKRKSDAGIDIYTNIEHPVTVNPGDGYTFTTGIRSEIPPGWCMLLWDRSSLGSSLIGKCAGVIDCEYRGEWKVTLANHGTHPREFLPGDKIVQGILTRVVDCEIRDVDNHPDEDGTLTDTERGQSGHGSSGR